MVNIITNEHRPVNVIRVETATIRRDTPQKSGCLGLVVKAIILLVVADQQGNIKPPETG